MSKQYLDKEGLEIVAEKVNEAREVGAGAMALAQEVSETSTIAFTGTFAEWNALSASEKAKFAGHIVNITDDTSDVQNAVRNPDWSRAIVVSTLPYTCPEDGLVVGCVRADSANLDVYINNKAIATTSVTKMAQFQCDVGSGDILSLGGTPTATDIRFVPYKTEVVVTEPTNYSTTEQFTGKFWIDGKKIYRKVINFGALPNTTTKSTPHNISNIDFVVSISGTAKRDNGTQIQLGYTSPSPQSNCSLYATPTDICIYNGTDQSVYDICYIIIEYTKSN